MNKNKIIDGQLNLINETMEFYLQDLRRRSITAVGGCVYVEDDTCVGQRNCAIGRRLPEGIKNLIREGVLYNGAEFGSLIADLKQCGRQQLEEWCQTEDYKLLSAYSPDFDAMFGSRLQRLHDMEYYWNEKGLTDRGTEYLAQLTVQVAEGRYTQGCPDDTETDN